MQKEFDFLHIAEKLKQELRHCWLSNGNRQESVAEHSWRLALMVFRYAGRLDQPVNIEKCLKTALIHDLAEAKAGDIPVFNCQSSAERTTKFEKEHAVMLEIKHLLNDEQGNELYDLWMEFENQESYESKFVRALDKLEAFIQHNESPLSTWEEREKRMIFQYKWLKKFCAFDSFLNELCSEVINHSLEKLKEGNEDLNKIKSLAEQEEKGWSELLLIS